MKKFLLSSVALAVAAVSMPAQAAVTFFVTNPTGNHQDWSAAVGSSVTNIDFDAPDSGASIGTFSGFTGPIFGAGPGQSNTFSPPLSGGQGLHAPSNHLQNTGAAFSLAVNFTSLVSGAGLDVIDYFGAAGTTNLLQLSAYTGANGTGTLLGSATAAQFNFQSNNIFFLGVSSTSNDIGSLVFSRATDNTGDILGIDNIVSAGNGGVPEPAAWALMIAGFGLVGAAARRRQSVRVTYA